MVVEQRQQEVRRAGCDDAAAADPWAVSGGAVGGAPRPALDVLRLAADADLGQLVPRMRFDLTGRSARVMELVEGTPASCFRTDGVLDPSMAAAIGGALGAWHLATSPAPSGARGALVTLPDPSAVGDRRLQAALGGLRSQWRPSAVIHGDVTAAHASVVGGSVPCGSPAVVLTSWYRSGIGDPAWDLGCLVADLLAGASEPAAAEIPVAAAVVAYGRTSGDIGPCPPSEIAAHFAQRTALCTVARLVARAVDDDGMVARSDLDPARAVANSLECWTDRVAGWLR